MLAQLLLFSTPYRDTAPRTGGSQSLIHWAEAPCKADWQWTLRKIEERPDFLLTVIILFSQLALLMFKGPLSFHVFVLQGLDF